MSKQPDLHLPFYGAEDNAASVLVGCLRFLQGMNFLVLAGFWRIRFPRGFYYRKFNGGVADYDNFLYILPSLTKVE